MEKISIGLPTYNRPDSLRRTLDTMLAQSYSNIEIVISDNGSPDIRVAEVINEYAKKDSRIIPFRQGKNIGIIRNFEFVLEKSTGRYFMWKSDDDWIEDKDYIQKLLHALVTDNCDFAFPECYYLKESDNSRQSVLMNIYRDCRTRFDYLNAVSKTFPCLEFYGLYDLSKFDKEKEFVLLRDVGCPDVYYIPHLFLNHKVKFVPEAAYTFVHAPSEEAFQRNLNIFKDRQLILRKLINDFSSTDKLSGEERGVIVSNILEYYEAIMNENFGISKYRIFKTKIKNFLKSKLGKAYS